MLRVFVEPRVAPSWCARVDGNKRKNGSPEIVLRVSRLAPLAAFLVSIEKWWGLELFVFRAPPFKGCCGGVLLSHTLPGAVPSALAGLASRFGMETGRFPAAMTTTR